MGNDFCCTNRGKSESLEPQTIASKKTQSCYDFEEKLKQIEEKLPKSEET